MNTKALKYKEPSKFPAIEIDVTFDTDVSKVNFEKVVEASKASCDIIRAVVVKDIYTAEDGSAALTLRFSFVSNERTLSKNELMPAVDTLTADLAKIGLNVKN